MGNLLGSKACDSVAPVSVCLGPQEWLLAKIRILYHCTAQTGHDTYCLSVASQSDRGVINNETAGAATTRCPHQRASNWCTHYVI